MILAIDMGNSNIVVGGIDSSRIYFEERLTTDRNKTNLEYAISIKNILEIHGIEVSSIEGTIISSVVPPLNNTLTTAIKKITGKTPLLVGSGMKTGLNIIMDNPKTTGSDMIVDAVAALKEYPAPLIIIDMGTATTYNYVDEKGAILAGLITTGIGTAAAALASNTAQLPEVQITRPKSILAANTKDAMQAGLYYDCLGGIERTITQFREELDTDFKVVATGGMSRIFDCPLIDIVDPTLIFKGMASIYAKNV